MIDCWWRRSVQRVKCCSTFVSVSCLCRSCRASVCPFSLSCRVASCSFISLCDTEKQQTTGLWLITWRAVDYCLEERFKFCPTLLISTTFNFLNSVDKSYSRTEKKKKCQASISPRLRWYVFKLHYLVISPLCSDLRKKRLNPQLLNKQCRRRARYERNKNQISGDVGLCQRKLGLISSQAHAGRTCTAQPSPSFPKAGEGGGRLGKSWMGRLLSRKAQSFVFCRSHTLATPAHSRLG